MIEKLPFHFRSLRAAYSDGLEPAAVGDEVLRRVEAAGDPGIFLHLRDRAALLTDVDELGTFDPVSKPLWGIPFTIKDNIDAADAPTTAACPAYTYEAARDAVVVELLRRAGAILIGKTNLDQFATGLVGTRTPYPVPRNALDPAIVPGGSSCGSAVAVARGLVGFALGTDTAGSGRVPAALNGIVGLKPTLGALSNTGVVPACRTLDTVSVFALTVEDAYDVFRIAAKFDADDPYARPIPAPAFGALPPAFRVGVPDGATREFFGDDVQADAFEAVLGDIAALGGSIVDMDFRPFFEVADMLYQGAWVAERHAVVEDLLGEQPDAFYPVTRQIIEQATRYSATDAFRGFYRLQELKRLANTRVDGVDLLCVPSVPTFYSVADVDADPMGPNSRLGTYTNFVNLMDMCGIAVPTAPRADGRPGSVTLLACAGRDAQIAGIAGALQRRCGGALGATGWALPDPVPTKPQPGPDEVAVAAVGAHMSGLPLNRELTERGARFLYAAKTASQYRLYSLPGGPPFRPGLVRDATGSAIALEVWALPSARFSDFMRGIPWPLGIGTLTLESGTEVKGFICEPMGILGAEDITACGGWRAYLDTLSTPQDKPQEPTKELGHA